MSFITDVLLPPPFFLGPVGEVLERIYKKFTEDGKPLFGSGEQPALPPPPEGTVPPGPEGQGPAQDRIDELSKALAEMQRQLEELHKAGEQATGETGINSEEGRSAHDQILGDGSMLNSGLSPQGGTPEADAGRLAAMQQQIDELTKNVEDKAGAANGIADSLRNLGTGLPGMGMPGLGGGPSLGMPGMGGGMPGVSPLGGSGLDAPAVSSTDDGPMKPPEVSSTSDDLEPPSVGVAGGEPQNPEPTPGATAPAAAPPPPGAPAAATPPGETKPAPPPDSTEITLPGGQVVSAPNPQAAAAVRNALSHPAGTGDVATTAYTGTGVDMPTDGADPGRKIDPADVKPGDIVVFDDHTAIVAGNGQLIGPDGKLQPLGVINEMPGFTGFFRPTETDDVVVPAPPGATPPASPPATSLPAGETVMAQPPVADPEPTSPGFGLPAKPHER